MRERQPSTMPTQYAIARYWHCVKKDMNLVIDLGEPACMACGYYAESWDKYSKAPRRWNESTLERAHIIAASLGGCNEPSNLLLLCHICHSEAPMVYDSKEMVQWAHRRESYITRRNKELAVAFRDAGVDIEDLPEDFTISELRRALDAVQAGMHFGYRSPATMACAVKKLLKWREMDKKWLDKSVA